MTSRPVRDAVGALEDEPSLRAAVGGAAIAGSVGGLDGGALSKPLDRLHAEYLDQRLARGGHLLWVPAPDLDRETGACQILTRPAPRGVHVHGVGHGGPVFVGGV